jgi:hypothetical protein
MHLGKLKISCRIAWFQSGELVRRERQDEVKDTGMLESKSRQAFGPKFAVVAEGRRSLGHEIMKQLQAFNIKLLY